MRVADRQHRQDRARRELIALLLASLACVVMLTVSLADSLGAGVAGFGVHQLLLLALAVGGAGIVIILAWCTTRAARQAMMEAQEESARLRRNLVTAEAIIKAEPQVIVLWEQGQGIKVTAHSLSSVQ